MNEPTPIPKLRGTPARIFVSVDESTGRSILSFAPADVGVASAMISSSQQVGGSIGVALLNTVATGSTASYLVTHGGTAAPLHVQNQALMHGYSAAYWLATIFVVAAALVSAIMVNAGAPEPPPTTTSDDVAPVDVPVPAH